MIVTGTDLIEIDRITNTLETYGERFLKRIYTQHEIDFCNGKANSLAGRFAAKEAVMKLLGTGIRGVGWKEIEIHRKRGFKPTINLYSRAKNIANNKGIKNIEISITHSKTMALAVAVGEIK
ncbi:MAG: holo-[acyl-carrier-protein] synthase [Chloroflexi bacterium]|nr:holo-[acyl-carrier-protein] synthase [Chloroflexota bacterium]